MLLPSIAFLALSIGVTQGDDPNLEKRWFSNVFGPERTAGVFDGKITRVSIHQPGFTMGERPGLELVEAKIPSDDWSRRFRAALLDVRHHEWQIRFTNPFKADVAVRFWTATQVCDVQISLATDEIRWWSDHEGHSRKQSIRPGREALIKLLSEVFPNLRGRLKERSELVVDERFDSYDFERSQQDARKRKAGLWGALPHEWIEILSAPDRVDALRLVGDLRTPAGKPIQASKAWARSFFQAMDNRDNIQWGFRNRCGFRPDVSLNFEQGAQTLTVQLCFGCNDLMVIDDGHPQASRKINFAPGRPVFLTLTRRLFPKDEELANLPLNARGYPIAAR